MTDPGSSLTVNAANRATRLPIVCMAFGNVALADLYVTRLHDMLERSCPLPFRLICYTDQPRNVPADVEQRDCGGWSEFDHQGTPAFMRKLGLFNPAYIEFDEFVYLDLTLVIRQSMQALLGAALSASEDLVIVKDWHYDCYNSSVMRIRPRPMRFIYDAFISGERFAQVLPGDQDFIHGVVSSRQAQHRVALLPEGCVASFKALVRIGRRDPALARRLTEQATVVKFHGRPRMHQAFDPVHHFFRIRLRDWAHGQVRSPIPVDELRSHWEGCGRPAQRDAAPEAPRASSP